jgi:hypothetical protein
MQVNDAARCSEQESAFERALRPNLTFAKAASDRLWRTGAFFAPQAGQKL